MTLDSRVSSSVEYRKPTLSPTAIDHAMICGRRLQYYMDPDVPHGGTNMSQAVGRAWHWMMEQWGRLRMYTDTETHDEVMPLLIGGAELTEKPGDGWFNLLYAMGVGHLTETIKSDEYIARADDDLDAACSTLWAMLTHWRQSPDAMWLGKGLKYQAVELRVLTEMGSEHHQMNGYIDAVLTLTTETSPELSRYEGLSQREIQTILVDYKSAGKVWGSDRVTFDEKLNRYIGDPRKIIQAPLYAEAWERTTGEVVDYVCFDVMTYKGKFMRVWVPVTPEKRAPMLERWQQVSDEIVMYREAGKDMPANPGHFMCSEKWCPFWDRCPMGAPYTNSGKARGQ